MDARMQSRAEELAAEFAGSATTIEELNQLMRLMMKSGLERMLDTEMDVHLGRRPSAAGQAEQAATATQAPPNRRNGRSQRTVQGELGEVTLSTPRDRAGTFEPVIVGKHQRRIPDFDAKILALYAKSSRMGCSLCDNPSSLGARIDGFPLRGEPILRNSTWNVLVSFPRYSTRL